MQHVNEVEGTEASYGLKITIFNDKEKMAHDIITIS